MILTARGWVGALTAALRANVGAAEAEPFAGKPGCGPLMRGDASSKSARNARLSNLARLPVRYQPSSPAPIRRRQPITRQSSGVPVGVRHDRVVHVPREARLDLVVTSHIPRIRDVQLG